MAKTAAFHGRISAGIDCKLKMVIHVFTEWAPRGFQRGIWRVTPLWVWSPLRRQTEKLIQADLVHFESRRNLVIRKEYLDTVIPEVCDRESI